MSLSLRGIQIETLKNKPEEILSITYCVSNSIQQEAVVMPTDYQYKTFIRLSQDQPKPRLDGVIICGKESEVIG